LLPIDEETHILFGGEPHHDPEPVPVRGVEQGSRWGRVRNADGVEAVGCHLGEVAFDDLWAMVFAPAGVGLERTVRDAAHVQRPIARNQELAPYLWPDERRGEDRRTRSREFMAGCRGRRRDRELAG